MNNVQTFSLDEINFNTLVSAISEHLSISLNLSHIDLLNRALVERLSHHNYESVYSYLEYLKVNPSEARLFISSLVDKERKFFQNESLWDYFLHEYLPNWYKDNDHCLKILCEGVLTGEEAYSIAICCEDFKSRHPDFTYKIIATDFSRENLVRARNAVYSKDSLGDINYNEYFLSRYFTNKDDFFEVNREVKNNIIFLVEDILEFSYTHLKVDLIFMRNFLTYFDLSTQERILNYVSNLLNNNGVVVLGEKEVISGLNVPLNYRRPFIYTKTEKSDKQKYIVQLVN